MQPLKKIEVDIDKLHKADAFSRSAERELGLIRLGAVAMSALFLWILLQQLAGHLG